MSKFTGTVIGALLLCSLFFVSCGALVLAVKFLVWAVAS